MNEKLKKIAVNLENSIRNFKTPKEVYDELLVLSKKQFDYFTILGAESIIKLTFLIYSYKKTNNFDLGNKMLDDSIFLFTIFSEGIEHRETCEACFGDGEVECNTCYGTGEISCHTCDETGELNCDTCDGSGIDPDNQEESCWDCNGAGLNTCPSCYGDTMETCPECDNRKLENCQNCDGIGEIETDDWNYEMEVILTWDKNLISRAIEFENTLVPIMSFEEYNKLNNYIIIKYYGGDNHLEFKKGFRSNEVYCFGHSKDRDVKLTSGGNIEVLSSIPFRNLSNYTN